MSEPHSEADAGAAMDIDSELHTPPPDPSSTQDVDSTPYSKGTASDAEYRLTETGDALLNAILKILIAYTIMGPRVEEPTDEDIEAAGKLFSKLLEAAVKFCNADLEPEDEDDATADPKEKTRSEQYAACQKVKEALKSYCAEKTEIKRYIPLTTALNDIVAAFRDENMGFDSSPSEKGDDEILFKVNDPTVLLSERLDKLNTSKRKPDIIALMLSAFKEIWGDEFQDFHFDDIYTNLTKDTKKQTNDPTRPNWSMVQQSWELKSSRNVINHEPLYKRYGEDGTTSQPPPPQQSKQSSRGRAPSNQSGGARSKRASDSSPTGSKSKKSRGSNQGSESAEAPKASPSIERLKPNLPKTRSSAGSSGDRSKSGASASKGASGQGKAPAASDKSAGGSKSANTGSTTENKRKTLEVEVQAAYYAMERQACDKIRVSHTIGLILEDADLRLCFYDSQGVIETKRLNIIDQLPIFVAMIMIFQRLNRRGWGQTPLSFDKMEFKDRFDRPITCKVKTSWTRLLELRGWNTYTATVTVEGRDGVAKHEDYKDDEYFLKLSNPEISRDAEYELIKEAKKRAEAHLPEDLARLVTDHLPEVWAWFELRETSTAIIRKRLDLKTDGARMIRGIILTLLVPISSLPPKGFWSAFWDTIICHALLWRIGIAHGDISLRNLMCRRGNSIKGVLNDLDLASFIRPGTSYPERKGFERTGTKPFMALDLLRETGLAGKVVRLYRHDLESFGWVLAWACACVRDRKENSPPPRLSKWVTYDFENVRVHKLAYISESFISTPEYSEMSDVAQDWLEHWRIVMKDQILSKKRGEELRELEDIEHLREIIQLAKDNSVSLPNHLNLGWVYEFKQLRIEDGNEGKDV